MKATDAIARDSKRCEAVATESNLASLQRLIVCHKAKLTPRYATENSRARHNACIAIFEAEIARREKEGPRLRALPSTYRPFDRWNTAKQRDAQLGAICAGIERDRVRISNEPSAFLRGMRTSPRVFPLHLRLVK